MKKKEKKDAKKDDKEQSEKIQVVTDAMSKQFQDMANKNEVAEVLKELFDEGKIYMIGDLTLDEIRIATRIHMIATMKNIQIWKDGLAFYCKLLLSKNRKSRYELLEAIKGASAQQGGILSRMGQKIWGERR